MHKQIYRLIAAIFLISFPLLMNGGPAEDATLRMKDRLAQVDALKSDGSVGENAAGFLEPRLSLGPRQLSIVEAENKDRKIIYSEVARKTGQTADVVGQQRALRIAEIAGSGVWLEKPEGDWYQKP